MSKKLKKSEFEFFLGKLAIEEDGKLPFFKNCQRFFDDAEWELNLSDYLLFIRLQIDGYRDTYKYGEIDFCTYVNKKYPPRKLQISEPEPIYTKEMALKDAWDALDAYFRENYIAEDKISVHDLQEIIEAFSDSIDSDEVEDED